MAPLASAACLTTLWLWPRPFSSDLTALLAAALVCLFHYFINSYITSFLHQFIYPLIQPLTLHIQPVCIQAPGTARLPSLSSPPSPPPRPFRLALNYPGTPRHMIPASMPLPQFLHISYPPATTMASSSSGTIVAVWQSALQSGPMPQTIFRISHFTLLHARFWLPGTLFLLISFLFSFLLFSFLTLSSYLFTLSFFPLIPCV